MGDEALLGAMFAQVAGQGPRIQPFDADDLRLLQIVCVPAAGCASYCRVRLASFTMNPSAQIRRRLGILRCHPIVSNMGRGHGDDLSLIRGIGQDFLVAGHGRVKHNFSHRLPFVSERHGLRKSCRPPVPTTLFSRERSVPVERPFRLDSEQENSQHKFNHIDPPNRLMQHETMLRRPPSSPLASCAAKA